LPPRNDTIGTPLELRIPVQVLLQAGRTIHQLRACKLLQALEGRVGYIDAALKMIENGDDDYDAGFVDPQIRCVSFVSTSTLYIQLRVFDEAIRVSS
jgi:hypothetical protein